VPVRAAFALALGLLVGCGDDGGSPDGSTLCASAADCDDGLFCNGADNCDPADPAADESGCVPGEPPCAESCNEADDVCSAACPDADRDGYASADCGGSDCDDADPNRYPGNPEICDPDGLDEDCDPTTFGPDEDGDGFVAIECCNQQRDGSLRCGRDCNDRSRAIAPGAVDTCGNGDEDCDGDVDENPGRTLYRDLDGDGQGTRDDTILGCEAGSGYVLLGDDCDDADDRRSPDFEEVCDSGIPGRDENCDGVINPGCPCTPGMARGCGATDVGECSFGSQSCVVVAGDEMNALWGECEGERVARDELCNGLDDDCDGSSDEAFECVSGTVATGTNACDRVGTRTCNEASCRWEPFDFARGETLASCDYCDDAGTGVVESLATQSTIIPLTDMVDRGDAELLGDAKETIGPLYVEDEWCFISNDGMAHHICLADATHYGGVASVPVSLGYQGFTATVAINVGVDAGFALSLVEPGTEALLGPGGAGLGVPLARTGVAAEWRRYDPATLAGEPTITVRRMQEPVDRVLATVPFVPAAGMQPELRVAIWPDLPLSPANETRLEVWAAGPTGLGSVYECGPPDAACVFALAPGTPLRALVSGSVLPGRRSAVGLFDSSHGDIDFVVSEGLCPP